MIFPAVMIYLQMSPGSVSYFFLLLAKWSKYTHKDPSDKSVFLHKVASVKSTPPSPALFHQEDATEKYQFSNYNDNMYLQLCVLFFHYSVSWLSEMQFRVMYLETLGITQTYVVFLILVFTGLAGKPT